MHLQLIAVTIITSCVMGSEVTQSVQERRVQEGDDVTLECSYTGTKYVLIWYRQSPQGTLHLLLNDESKNQGKEFGEHLSAHHHPEQKTFNLSIRKSQQSDTGIYYCTLEYGTVC